MRLNAIPAVMRAAMRAQYNTHTHWISASVSAQGAWRNTAKSLRTTPGGAFVDEIVKAPPPPASPPLEYDAADAPRSSRSRSTMRWCPPPVTDSPAVTNTAAT